MKRYKVTYYGQAIINESETGDLVTYKDYKKEFDVLEEIILHQEEKYNNAKSSWMVDYGNYLVARKRIIALETQIIAFQIACSLTAMVVIAFISHAFLG